MNSVIGLISFLIALIVCSVFLIPFEHKQQLRFEKRRIEMFFDEAEKRGFLSK